MNGTSPYTFVPEGTVLPNRRMGGVPAQISGHHSVRSLKLQLEAELQRTSGAHRVQ